MHAFAASIYSEVAIVSRVSRNRSAVSDRFHNACRSMTSTVPRWTNASPPAPMPRSLDASVGRNKPKRPDWRDLPVAMEKEWHSRHGGIVQCICVCCFQWSFHVLLANPLFGSAGIRKYTCGPSSAGTLMLCLWNLCTKYIQSTCRCPS